MKKTLLIATALIATTITQAQWNIDKSHSSIGFTVSHMVVSEVEGGFKDFSGNITADKADFTDLKGEITIQAASITTNDDKRDGHLKGADFFDVAKYPTVTFKIESVKKVTDKKYTIQGDMNLHGVTKKVSWDLAYNGTMKDPYGFHRAGFKATTTINRKDYGISYGQVLDTGGAAVGDEVTITVRIELTKK